MQLERGKQLRFDDLVPGASADAGGVIEDQLPGCAPDVFEDGAQSVADAFGGFPAVGLDKAHIRVRKRDDQDVQRHPLAVDDGVGLPEVDLSGAGVPGQFDVAVTGGAVGVAPGFDVALDRRIRTGVVVFVGKAVKDASAGVALFTGTILIILEPTVDDGFEAVENFRPGAFHWRRWCRGEILDTGVLGHRVAADAESAGDVAAGDSLGVESPDIFYNGHGYRHLLSGSFLDALRL